MKADLCADGHIVITPESGVEAYALDAWCNKEFSAIPSTYRPKLVVDFSEFPDLLKRALVEQTK